MCSNSKKRIRTLYNYTIDGAPIHYRPNVRDLGVIVDEQLTFRDHYSNIIRRAYRSLGYNYRTCKEFNCIDSLKTLYYALVRSGLEYASQVWSPFVAKHKHAIERVQRKFTSFLYFKLRRQRQEYEDRLVTLSLRSLEDRRLLLDTLYLHRVTHCQTDSSGCDLQQRTSVYNLRTAPTFEEKSVRTVAGRWTNPTNRLLHTYNALAANLEISIFDSTLPRFKKAVITELEQRRTSN